ncbi:CRP-like cAMP-binding protein [Mesonia hippocampi]|uniref:CRP-like cAMP-binding protein n=1 Tax=Mesonia hippocampi TaxID=1628250 RepID=A0A840END7_9FLAO|nr:Crp/Fnr family transcriptional regulator [Mesonia hippocampi]MBB4118615.1 CRP-like cAMP-binding protein [Mesonia hippocampi]
MASTNCTDTTNLIKHIQAYVSLTDTEITQLTAAIQVKTVKKKEYLVKTGNICKDYYFVSQGCLRMFFIKENGTEQITQFAIENWWMTDHMSLLKQQQSPFYIQAIENTNVIILHSSTAEKLFKKIPALEKYFRIILQHAYAASQFRIKYLYDYSREELYTHFAAHFPDFLQRVPQYMLASYLGFTPEYLSEIRKKLQNNPS